MLFNGINVPSNFIENTSPNTSQLFSKTKMYQCAWTIQQKASKRSPNWQRLEIMRIKFFFEALLHLEERYLA